jgi:hypothetical protein
VKLPFPSAIMRMGEWKGDSQVTVALAMSFFFPESAPYEQLPTMLVNDRVDNVSSDSRE